MTTGQAENAPDSCRGIRLRRRRGEDPVLARFLCFVHGLVGAADEIVAALVRLPQGDARAESDDLLLVVVHEYLLG